MAVPIDLTRWEDLPDSTYLTIAEVCRLLRVSARHVQNAVTAGRLEAVRLAGRGRGVYRIEKRAVVRYVRGGTVRTPRVTPRQRAQQADGQFLRHLKPTWLHGPLPLPGVPAPQPDGRSTPSSEWTDAP